MGLAQANACFWKTGPKSAPLSGGASQSKATGVVSGPQEATPWNLLCGPGLLPQQSILGTNDSGSLEPPNLSINKTKQKPSRQWSLLAQAQLAWPGGSWLS